MIFISILTITLFLQLTASHSPSLRSVGCGTSNTDGYTQTAGGSATYTMTVNDPFRGDMSRKYIVHLPPNYNHNAENGESVLFALPGFLTSAQEFEDGMKINGNSDDNNYIIVYAEGNEMFRANGESIFNWNDLSSSVGSGPAGPICDPDNINSIPAAYNNECGKGWRTQPEKTCIWTRCDVSDLKFIQELAIQIENDFCIDTSREYVMGNSNGAMMTQRIACEMNDRFSAAVTLHGQLQIGFNCAPKKGPKMPIMNVYATNDQILPGIATDLVNEDVNGGTMAAVSRNNWYFTPVNDVQIAFADFNKCDINDGQSKWASVNQGTHQWKCTAFTKHCYDAPAVQCQYVWRHLVYAVEEGEDTNFIMPGVWQFLSRFEKPQKGTSSVFKWDQENKYNVVNTPSSLTWVWIIGGVLAVILSLNIGLLCYLNCCQRGNKYTSVKYIDSEFYDSEKNPINA